MRIVETVDLCSAGDFPTSPEWRTACNEVEAAIVAIDWPHGSGSFTIRPVRKGNGVVPIKVPCVEALQRNGWQTETLPDLGTTLRGGQGRRTGDLDALRVFPGADEYRVGFEWETGNISSSHRALNKLVNTMREGAIQGGILVLPMRALAQFLTDRIGNFEELQAYFDLYTSMSCVLDHGGALRIVGVVHDEESEECLLIPKGTDGRARR